MRRIKIFNKYWALLSGVGEVLKHLLISGIKKDDVPIMLDQLRYFVEE